MTPLERFNAWVAGKSGQGMTYGRLVYVADECLRISKDDVERAVRQIRHWLIANENNRKANKRLWGKFMLNWLTPKSSRQQGRLEPSDFN